MKKISVIVPIYNVAQYLKECIQSIVVQTYKNLEIILVNDGSTDDSGEICDLYAQNDERIIVIHKKNGGLVSARKAGLDVASGEYVGFVDGDDYIAPTFYEVLLNEIVQSNADFVHTGYFVKSDKVSYEEIAFEEQLVNNNFDIKVNLIKDSILKYGNEEVKLSPFSYVKVENNNKYVTYYDKLNDVMNSIEISDDVIVKNDYYKIIVNRGVLDYQGSDVLLTVGIEYLNTIDMKD